MHNYMSLALPLHFESRMFGWLLMVRWLKKNHWEQSSPHPYPFVEIMGCCGYIGPRLGCKTLGNVWETFRKPSGNELPEGGFPKGFLVCFRRVAQGFPDFVAPDCVTLGQPCERCFVTLSIYLYDHICIYTFAQHMYYANYIYTWWICICGDFIYF